MRALIAASLLVGCGAPTPDCPVCPEARQTVIPAVKARAVPGVGGYRMCLAVDDATAPEVFWGLYYGATAQGWRVTVVGPASETYPVEAPITEVKPAEFDALVVSGPVDVKAIAPYFKFVAAVGEGSAALEIAGTGHSPTGEPGEFVRMHVEQPGEVPVLLHRMQMYAADRLRVRHRATGGHPP